MPLPAFIPELVSHEELGRLRLSQFVSSDRIRELKNWEYEDNEWVGEADLFTEVLRLAHDPEVVRSVALDLKELPDGAQEAFWLALKLPLRKGMTFGEVSAVLGAPAQVQRFLSSSDRTTYEFPVGKRWPYVVGCTILADDGLSYVTVRAEEPPEP